MHRLSMAQALSIWSELEDAIRGTHGYGGHVAEIYVYRLQKRNPSAEAKLAQASDEEIKEANESLYALLVHFSKTRNAMISIEIWKGRWRFQLLGPWLKNHMEGHRWHIRVEPLT